MKTKNKFEHDNGAPYVRLRSKKAQEEVMGFVIIVLIVMIIAVVFFGFALRKPSAAIEPKQAELDDMMLTTLSYTTSCSINMQNQSIRELIRQCHNNPSKLCDSTLPVCLALNSTLEDMYSKLLGQGSQIANQYVHGYSLNISNGKQVFFLQQGNLSGNYFASSTPIPTLSGSDVIMKLKYYYSGQSA